MLLAFANLAFGNGPYQRTKDGRTLVWNNYPKPGDEATWSGSRDGEGYAHGFGTLTWYTIEPTETGSGEPALYARYWGHMERGKFNGPVNVHSRGKTDHAIFVDGVRMTRWVTGPAPYRANAHWRAIVQRSEIRAERSEIANRPAAPAVPETPAEGPVSAEAEKAQGPSSKSTITESSQPLALNLPKRGSAVTSPRRATTAGEPRIGIDNSLRLLVWPPRSLHMRSSLTANVRLTKQDVLNLADAIARSRGYDPAEYEHSDPQYDPAYRTWSIIYDQTPVDGTAGIGKHFSVAVSDETKATALVAGE